MEKYKSFKGLRPLDECTEQAELCIRPGQARPEELIRSSGFTVKNRVITINTRMSCSRVEEGEEKCSCIKIGDHIDEDEDDDDDDGGDGMILLWKKRSFKISIHVFC